MLISPISAAGVHRRPKRRAIWREVRHFNIGPDEEWANSFPLQPFWYAEKPDNGPDWALQFQMKFLFPK